MLTAEQGAVLIAEGRSDGAYYMIQCTAKGGCDLLTKPGGFRWKLDKAALVLRLWLNERVYAEGVRNALVEVWESTLGAPSLTKL